MDAREGGRKYAVIPLRVPQVGVQSEQIGANVLQVRFAALELLGECARIEGKFEEAAVAAQKDAADYARLLILSCARWGQKRIPESDAALAELIAKVSETGAYQIAEVYAYRNDKDRAFEWLERAHRQRDAGLPNLRTDTLLQNLHDDPRWDAFLRTMGLADDQLK